MSGVECKACSLANCKLCPADTCTACVATKILNVAKDTCIDGSGDPPCPTTPAVSYLNYLQTACVTDCKANDNGNYLNKD